jgi:hypothetical protein
MEPSNERTAAACSRRSCIGCEIEGRLLCVATLKDVAEFGVLFVNWFVPFLAGMIIGEFWIGLAVWLGLAVLFFAYVEALLLCRHCPAYAEKGFMLRCHANWGMPKIPKFDPRPVGRIEGRVCLLYAAVLFLYHIPFFVLSGQWLLLAWGTWAFVAWLWVVRRTQCTRCCHLSCPLNRVSPGVREAFFRNYPEFAGAWREAGREEKPA